MSSFSGGWRMRVALAGVLFLEPDLLLLDEPTNHLDLEAAIWLEEHLRRYPRTLILVSHDRDFLNSVPEKTCHLEGRKLTLYAGGYDRFERTRRERLVLAEKARERPGGRARPHPGLRRPLPLQGQQGPAGAEPDQDAGAHGADRPGADRARDPLLLPGRQPSPPRRMVTMDAAKVGYGDRAVLVRPLAAPRPGRPGGAARPQRQRQDHLRQADRRAAGADGGRAGPRPRPEGRLLRPAPDRGPRARRRPRSSTSRPAARPSASRQTRAWLARFGLGQDQARTKARHLSGGEKTRLALALMCLDAPQLLILDEPTNHLDIDSREALVEAVNEFPGAVIVISHDRHLVELVADSLWLVEGGQVRPYDGDMDDYRRLLLETSAEPPAAAAAARRPPSRRRRLPAGERRRHLAPLRQRAKEAERADRAARPGAGVPRGPPRRPRQLRRRRRRRRDRRAQKRLAELRAQTEAGRAPLAGGRGRDRAGRGGGGSYGRGGKQTRRPAAVPRGGTPHPGPCF